MLVWPALWALLFWAAWAMFQTRTGRWLLPETALFGIYLCLIPLAAFLGPALWRLACAWSGIDVPDDGGPVPSIERMDSGFWWNGSRYWRSRTQARLDRWAHIRFTDPRSWRQVRVLATAPFTAAAIAASPVCLLGGGIAWLIVFPGPWRWAGVLPIIVSIGVAPLCCDASLKTLVWLMRPPKLSRMQDRVNELTTQRADVTAASAAELRRIERDLHDGPQARLLALGLTLGSAERRLGQDLESARDLLREAQDATVTVLEELRELVHGIYPPVLSERGLLDAVRQLALDAPIQTSVSSTPAATDAVAVPIQVAVYFCICEIIANTVKHADATQVAIAFGRERDQLIVEVTDDGAGGVRHTAGGGIQGMQRRLSAFDGTLAIHSPAGGPTTTRIEVPCGS